MRSEETGGSIFLSAGGGSIAFIGARSDRLTFHGDLTALASGDVLRRISDLDSNPTGPDTTLTAQGRVSISAGGDIRLGVVKVQNTLHLQAADVIDLKNISAGAQADVSAGGSIHISGSASISRAVRISASVLRFDEPLVAGSVSIRGQTLTAQLLSAASGDLSVVARAAFTQAGGLYAHRNIDIRVGTALDISYDQISAGGSIFLSAGGGSIAFIGARSDRLTLHGDLTALASGDVLRRISDLDSNPTGPDTTLSAQGRVSISAGGDIRLGVVKVQDSLHLQAQDAIDLKGVSAGAQADVSAGGSVHISGSASISRAVRLSASVLRLDEPLIAGSVSIRGQTLTARLLSASAEDLSVVAGAAFTQAGGLYAHRNIDIRVGTALDISHGQISAGGSIFLSAGGGSIAFIGARSEHITFQSDLTALASGDILHRISDLDANPTGPDTTLSAQGRVRISAGGDIRLGVLRVRSDLHLRAQDAIDLKGVSAGAQADISAGVSAHISGAASVSRAVRISASVLRMDAPLIAGSISIRGVTLIAQRLSAFSGDLSVDSGVALSQSGGMHAHRDVYVHSSQGLTVSFAEITAGSNLTLSSARRDIVLFGPANASLLVGGDTTVRAAGDVLRSVPQPAPGQVNQDTTLSSGGRMGISAGGSVHLGVLQARKEVQILAGEISLRGVSSGAEISLSVAAALSVPRLSAAGTLVWLQAAGGNISVQQVDAPGGLVSVQGWGFTAGRIAGERMTLNLDRFAGRFAIASSRIDGAVSLHGRSGLMRHAGVLNLAGVLLDAFSLSSDAVRQIPDISAAVSISLLRFSGGDLMLNSHSENWLRTVRASIVLGDIGIHSGIDLTLHSDAALEGGLVSASAGGNLAFDAAGAVYNSRQTVRLKELIAEGDLVIGGVDDPEVQALEYGGGSITLTRNRALPGRLMGRVDRTWTRRVGDLKTGWFEVAVGGVVSAGGAISMDVQGGVSLGDIRAAGEAVIRTGRTLADGSVQGIGAHGGVLAGHIQAETLILGVRQWGATVEHLNISQSIELDAARARMHGTVAGVFGENAQHYATIPSPKYIGPYQLNGAHIFGHRQRGLDRTDLAGAEQGRVRFVSLYFNEGLRFSDYRQNVLRHQGQTGRTFHLPSEESRALWRVHKIWVEPQLARELNLKGEMFLVNPRLPERSEQLRKRFEDQDGPGHSP
ncbi:MAG: hypothetical protein ISN29_06055 [Gammaproteobacteria bacterium AqS3]|nr:hypothetical protein [Gammaproteobacteria bacterium AqS3]